QRRRFWPEGVTAAAAAGATAAPIAEEVAPAAPPRLRERLAGVDAAEQHALLGELVAAQVAAALGDVSSG
ncbi:hypothetical protein VM98_37080, partial [Streptomyces rubellomurinus subsp. indigoferus]